MSETFDICPIPRHSKMSEIRTKLDRFSKEFHKWSVYLFTENGTKFCSVFGTFPFMALSCFWTALLLSEVQRLEPLDFGRPVFGVPMYSCFVYLRLISLS